jgi:ABC-type lipoprotein export system ATPase subunit
MERKGGDIVKITVSTPVQLSARCAQLRGLFDLPDDAGLTETWEPSFDLTQKPWNIGLIVGPSGCGKSTVAENLFAAAPTVNDYAFQANPHAAIIDNFPKELTLKEITETLSSVGFSSPPAWLRPMNVLSTGQRFRAELAIAIASHHPPGPFLCDEFTSVVDRTVAQIGSAAIARTIRTRNLQFVAVSCHSDIIDWLQPDWTYEPAENRFTWRLLHRRPNVTLRLFRCTPSTWTLFARHHYLSHELNTAAACWLCTANDQPACFTSWLHFFGRGSPAKREHRTVCLPDYQGIGIGNTVSATIASMYTALGYKAISTTTHPAMIAARNRSPLWQLTRQPSLGGARDQTKHGTRLTASFRYAGPPMQTIQAKALLAS